MLCKLESAGPALPWLPGAGTEPLSGCCGSQACCSPPQGVDDLISPDALSTVREMDVANFRRVSRMPIYGTAQPSAKVTWVHLWGGGRGRLVFSLTSLLSPQALGSILAYLTDAKRKLRQVVWVNLREEAVLECDGHTHSLRWHGPPMTADQLEVRLFCLLCTHTLEASWGIGLGGSLESPMLLFYRWRN